MTRRAELIRAAIDAAVDDMRVAMPGAVERVDVSAQTVDVRPLLLNRLIDDAGDITQEEIPVLPSVPINWPRAGGFFITMPITVGDTGLLIFPDFSIDQWRAKGGTIPVDPLDLRSHSVTSAVFVPGLHAKNNTLADAHASNMVLGKDGGSHIHIKPGGEVHVGSENAADFVALAQKVFDEIDALRTTVANIVTDVNNLKTAFSAWIPVPSDGGAALQAATTAWSGASISSPAAVNSVAATKTKAD